MALFDAKSFDRPDETRPFVTHGQIDLVSVGHTIVGRSTFEPGWKWSEHVKPIAGTESCQVTHAGYIVSGRIIVRMDDGSEIEAGPGDILGVEPGHDAWVVGDAPCVFVDFGASVAEFAVRS